MCVLKHLRLYMLLTMRLMHSCLNCLETCALLEEKGKFQRFASKRMLLSSWEPCFTFSQTPNCRAVFCYRLARSHWLGNCFLSFVVLEHVLSAPAMAFSLCLLWVLMSPIKILFYTLQTCCFFLFWKRCRFTCLEPFDEAASAETMYGNYFNRSNRRKSINS